MTFPIGAKTQKLDEQPGRPSSEFQDLQPRQQCQRLSALRGFGSQELLAVSRQSLQSEGSTHAVSVIKQLHLPPKENAREDLRIIRVSL